MIAIRSTIMGNKAPDGDAVNIIHRADRPLALPRSAALSNSTTPDSPAYIRVPIGHGYYAVIDKDDAALLEGWRWHPHVVRNTVYARGSRSINGKTSRLYLHQAVMQSPAGMDVDHINGDGLDNRRANLRVCTRQQNLFNQGARAKAESPYKGVHFYKRTKRWTAQIRINGKVTQVGTFDTAEEAARAYDRVARETRGEFAVLNFPDDETVHRPRYGCR